jgi:SAM-dependent methyltransferase
VSASDAAPAYRFYGELAPWWPLISPVEEYADEALEFARVLARASRPVQSALELGSGGGHVAFHLKRQLSMTLSDVSAAMLAQSTQLNPECAHVQGDMRSLRLGRRFDAVLVHDAIEYMTSESDLALAMATAFTHCQPDGLAIFVPDQVTETFAPSTDCGGSDAADGRGARYLEWSYDPDPADTTVTTHYSFLLRETDGRVSTATETHLGGLFSQDTWLRLVEQAGFEAEVAIERTDEDREPRRIFLGHRVR